MVALYLGALALLAVYGSHRLWLTALAWHVRDRSVPEPLPLPDELPVITVQLPLFNERYVAARAIAAAAALDWPRDRLEIQVLDDSTDVTRELCAREAALLRADGIDIVHLHRANRAGFKAGALAAGLAVARGELVLVLDADFVPPPGLLRSVAGSFADPRVGMVQARWEHLNRNCSLLTRVQALLLDGHFGVEQLARARAGRFFNFNGTAGVWRRRAIEDAGGWHCDTLTEDLDLSYRALLRGWRFVYRPGIAAPAELPVGMSAFKAQQYRWAKGSIEVARKLLPAVLRAPLPLATKLEAFFHLTQNVPYLLTLALALAAVPAVAASDFPWGLHAALALATLGAIGAYATASQVLLGRRSGLRALAAAPLVMAVTAGICVSQSRAVLEALLGYRTGFVRTPKHGITARGQTWRHLGYRAGRGAVPLAELVLALWFGGAAVGLAGAGQPWGIPICGLFAAGFGYVGAKSALGR